MFEPITVGLTVTCLVIVVPNLVKAGRTLSRIETKLDALLNHNGIDPNGGH